MYRQALPEHELSIEQGTSSVPDDGYYHVLHKGARVGRYRSLAKATERYRTIKDSLGIKPPPPPEPISLEEMIRSDMHAKPNKMLLWSEEDFRRLDRMTRGRPKHGGGRR